MTRLKGSFWNISTYIENVKDVAWYTCVIMTFHKFRVAITLQNKWRETKFDALKKYASGPR